MGLPYSGTIEIGKSGDTMYPVKDTPKETKDVKIVTDDVEYKITNHE